MVSQSVKELPVNNFAESSSSSSSSSEEDYEDYDFEDQKTIDIDEFARRSSSLGIEELMNTFLMMREKSHNVIRTELSE